MRKTYVLSAGLQQTKLYKRRQLNDKDISIPEMIVLLKKHGYDIKYRKYPSIVPAKEYKGIKIGSSN